MTYKTPPQSVRRTLRERAGNRCEYCRHSADFASGPFVCEHIWPRVLGAGDTLDELAWACSACNGHKHAKTHALDSQTKCRVRLFNPRRQKWTRHFAWSDDTLYILGRTAVGRATIAALQLNHLEVVNLRRALKAIGEHPPQD